MEQSRTQAASELAECARNMYCRIQVGLFSLYTTLSQWGGEQMRIWESERQSTWQSMRLYACVCARFMHSIWKLVYCFVSFGLHFDFEYRHSYSQGYNSNSCFYITLSLGLYVFVRAFILWWTWAGTARCLAPALYVRFIHSWFGLHRARGAFTLFNLNLNLW